jgi:hypothetical protein
MWLLAEKLKARGFANLYDYYASFVDPETGKKPASAAEFAEIAAKITSQIVWNGKEKMKGDQIAGWAEFRKRGIYNTETYAYRKNWGKDNPVTGKFEGKFKTETKKFEFYSETMKKAFDEHAKKHNTTVDDILQVSGYEARGELAFVPHYESPKRWGSEKEYPFTFIDYKSRLNREGRSQNTVWYHEFKKLMWGMSWEDVVKINPADGKARRQDRRHGQTELGDGEHHGQGETLGRGAARHHRQMLWPGTLGLRPCRRQGLCQGDPERREQQRAHAR